MGIDISGGMFVGEHADKIEPPEGVELYEFADDSGMDSYSEHYDADDDYTYYGFSIDDILVSDIDDAWISDIKEKAARFEKLTGVPARLIGSQDVW